MNVPIKLKVERYLYPCLFIMLDYLAILLAEKGALILHNMLDSVSIIPYMIAPSYIYLWIPLVFILFLGQSRSYEQMKPIMETVQSVFYSVMLGLISCVVALYFFEKTLLASRLFVLLFGILLLINIYVIRCLVHVLLKKFHLFYEPVILIGAGKTAERVLRFFNNDRGYRYDIAGIIDDAPLSKELAENYLLYGNIDEAEVIIRDAKVQTVIITAPGMDNDKLADLIGRIQPYVRNVSFVPDLIGTPMTGVEPQVLFSEEVLLLRLKNNLARRRNRIIKRSFDIIVTIVGGLLISPVLLIVTIMVAVENHGHVIFAHKRVGKNGILFPCYKFQSMVPNAQEKLKAYLAQNPSARKEWEETFKLTNDPRITKLGAFLRKTSLDELPQLWNVIKGDMSLVGPRPIVQEEIDKYDKNFREYSMVLPGITGMWQASGRSDTTYEERVAMDTWYVRNWSIWIDIMYLFKTIKAVFVGKGAY